MNNRYQQAKLPPFQLLDEPLLSFSSIDKGSKHVHPLRGLLEYGPFSNASFSHYSAQVRIAVICPNSGWARVGKLMDSIRNSYEPGDRKEYVPAYPGFESVFGIPLVAADSSTHIKWPDDLSRLGSNGGPSDRLSEAFQNAFKRLSLVRDKFDVAIFHLPDEWAYATKTESYNAHDVLKGLGAQFQIPTQVLNDRSFTFGYRASISWRLGIALYVKAGGIPWKLAPSDSIPDGTAFIGLAYAMRGQSADTHFVTCCSQVFDMDGGGMEFVAYEANDPIAPSEDARSNPYLSREDMRAVMSRSLHLYQRRNGGAIPKRLVIHKTTPFKDSELKGAYDALSSVQEIECIQVGHSPSIRGVWLQKPKSNKLRAEPAKYPVPRGTMLIQNGTSCFLWVAGNAPIVSSRSDYYQGSKSIPRPLYLKRFAGRGPLEAVCFEALALTKMDWNNDALYDPVPVTIRYAQRLARNISNVPELPGNSYPYRLFM